MAEHCLPIGSSEQIPCFALLVHTAITLAMKLSLSQLTCFSQFYTSDSLPHSHWWGVSEQLYEAELLSGIN